MPCVYCQGNKSQKITKEHLISRVVLETVFGPDNRNITRSELFGNKLLLDHEHTVKDVCEYCNNITLSPYDVAGAILVKEINKSCDATNKELPIDFESLAWILKTHLNLIRMFPEKGTKNYYPVSQDIYTGIINKNNNLFKKLKFYIEGWQGLPYFWDENDNRRIQFFGYTSIHFPFQGILVSKFRIKWLNTFILIPSGLNYSDFESRVKLTINAMADNYGFNLQEINVETAIQKGNLVIQKVAKAEDIIKIVTKL